MNSRDAAHIGFSRGLRGCSTEVQTIHTRNAGARVCYDAKEVTGEWVVHQHPEPPVKGKGITVYVYMLALLPDEGAVQLSDMMAELAASYSVVVETATGLRSDDPKQRRIMLEFAHQSLKLRRRARLPVGIAKRGRRPGDFSGPALEAAKRIWLSKKYASDPIAEEHLPEGMTRNQARLRFGPSGRPPGRKPQQRRRR